VKNPENIAPSKGKSILLSVLFIGIIALPLLNKQLHFFSEEKDPEFKYSPKPEFTYQSIDSFPLLYEKYYNEHIGFTSAALDFNARFKLYFLNVSPNQSKVLVGQDNWLFSAGKPINDYRGNNLLSDEEIQKLKSKLHARALNLKAQGGVFYFAIVPNKHRIYAEFLPNNIIKQETKTIYDQAVEALQSDTLIHLIDLRAPLEKAKGAQLLYYKKDNHWNDLGAYIGYKTITENVHRQFPHVSPVPADAYYIDTSVSLAGGDALQIGVDKLVKEHRIMLKPKKTVKAIAGEKQNYVPPADFPYPNDFEIVKVVNDPSLPTAVIIRDSFCDFMLQFFSENYRKTVFVFDNWEYKENRNIIEKERPNIVILETLEQNIRRITEFD
jgi:alginate O-acetyltransferase complex protein AlgJ